jgi:purine-binding chemotaxis protein CheW
MITTISSTSALHADAMQLATFYVADLCLALQIEQIQEIMRPAPLTRVPHSPPEVSGVINLRGEVTTIIDLRRVLGLPPSRTTAEGRILIVRSQGESIGLIVDRVADIYAIAAQTLSPPPANVGAVDGRFFRGVSQRQDEIVVLLNLEASLITLPSASK